MTDIERRRLPDIVLRSLNDAAFEVRAEWKAEIPSVFDRPTPFTLNAPLYRKATRDKLEAEVYIRDDATKGTPPSEYLRAEVFGGNRKRKRSEVSLARALDFPAYFIPGDVTRDSFGNIRRGTITKILSQLRASADPTQRETDLRRGRRLRRQQRRGGGGSYFTVPVRRGQLRPGVVYERIESGFGSAVRPILIGVRTPPRYRKRYDVFALAQSMFARRFSSLFRARLSIATGGRL